MRRTPIVALLVLLPILAFVAGCGASGGDDADSLDKTATTAAPSDDDSGEETTTTAADEDDDPGTGPSPEALADILPTADEIGPGYEVSDEDLSGDEGDEPDDDGSGDEDDPTEQAIIDQCPGAEILNELDNSADDNVDEVSREFETPEEATIEVALDPTPEGAFTEENVGKIVEGLADCGTISTEDDDGNAIEMTISAEENDEFGDYGMTMEMTAKFSMMGMTIPIEFHGMIFDVDGTTVSVIATSGLDEATFDVVPGDYDLLPELAATLQDRVASL